jgi:hypothetical protein
MIILMTVNLQQGMLDLFAQGPNLKSSVADRKKLSKYFFLFFKILQATKEANSFKLVSKTTSKLHQQ